MFLCLALSFKTVEIKRDTLEQKISTEHPHSKATPPPTGQREELREYHKPTPPVTTSELDFEPGSFLTAVVLLKVLEGNV